MKQQFSDFVRKFQYPVLLASMLTPISLVILAIWAKGALAYAWTLPVAYVVCAWVCFIIPGKFRLWVGLFESALLLVLGRLIAVHTGSNLILVSASLYTVALLFGLPLAGWSWKQELSGFLLTVGVFVHIIAQILVFAFRHGHSTLLEPVATWLWVCFLVYAPLVMLCVNRKNLITATMGKQNASANVRYKNTAIVLVFFIVLVLIGTLPVVVDAIEIGWHWLMGFLASIKLPEYVSDGLTPPTSTESETATETSPFVSPQNEPNPFIERLWNFLFAIAHYVVILVLIVLAIALSIWLYRKISALLRWLFRSLNRFANATAEDYEDEITDTRDDQEKQNLRRSNRLQQLLINERKLPPREQIRFRYRRLMKKHPEWGLSSTARRNLPEPLAECYEQARYSERELTEADARLFASETKRL